MNTTPLAFLRARLPLWATALLVCLTLAGGLSGGIAIGLRMNQPAPTCPAGEEVCQKFAIFWEAWNLVEDYYVTPGDADPAAMTAGAINGMLDALGDNGHTRFVSADEARALGAQQKGASASITASITVHDGQVVVIAPLKGSPAEAAGLRTGDIILAVDEKPTQGWTLSEAQQALRGPSGSTVVLKVRRLGAGEPVDLRVTRAAMRTPSVAWGMLPDAIALVQLASFEESTGADLRQALTMAQKQGAHSLVLDLRNNPGGLLSQAIEVASQFLPQGTPIMLEEERDGSRVTTAAHGGGAALDLPLIVLVNEGSASSSEIVSGALQASGRATLVGETSFGTGTVLTPYRLSDGSRLLLGTQQWLMPDGQRIRGRGVAPDEQVALPLDAAPLTPDEAAGLSEAELLQGADVQLARALELLAHTASLQNERQGG